MLGNILTKVKYVCTKKCITTHLIYSLAIKWKIVEYIFYTKPYIHKHICICGCVNGITQEYKVSLQQITNNEIFFFVISAKVKEK